MAKVKSDFRKKLQYSLEIVAKLQTLNANEWETYLDYCEKKTKDFPDDLNYFEAVAAVKSLYDSPAIEPVETLTITLTKTQLDIIKIALSGLIGTTQNVELRTAADGLFSELKGFRK